MVYKSKRRASEEQTSGAFTPNYKYPTFHTGGSKNNHFVQIGEALKDIDHRLGATGDAKVKVDNIVDATDLGKDILLSADTEDVRDILEVQTVAETKTAIDAAVTTEANTRTAEDARLQTAINNETAARTSADAALQTKIEEETTARTEADATLQTNIDNEAEAREAAVTAEADARTKADDKLTADLAAEVANRTKAVADEQTAREIADQTEAATREKQDAAITAAINTEILDRKNADAALQTKIEEETAARTAADKTLTDNLAKEVSDREAAVSQEATARTDGDANLQTAIDTEKADRTAAVKTVSDAVAKETADRTAAVTAESTARVEADRTLQNNIDAEKAARTEADTTLQNNIDLKADKTALPTKVSELQNDSDFQSGAQVDAKIAEATTTVYNYKGAVNTPDDLPAGSKQNPNKVGDTYNDKSTGMNYVWDGKAWDALGAVTTLTTLGVTATANELNYTDGVTAPIQTQLDAKQTKDDANAFETLVGETYATKTEMTDSLALKQDAATAFDGKYTSLTEVPSEFTPKAHTHVMADITDLDLSQFADYEIDMDHVIQIDSRFATTAIGMKAGVYLVTEGADTPAEIQEWKGSVGFEGALTGYLHLFDYMPDGERHDHLALLMAAIRSADCSQYASGMFVFDGPQNKWKLQTAGMDEIRGLDAALALKADKTEIGDMLTKTEAAAAYQPKGEYATTAQIADMETKAEAAEKFTAIDHNHDISDIDGLQGALDAKADKTAIADMETKTDAAAAYATKGELAAKQDAATAFDGKYTSLTEVPSQFTPAAHTHAIADVTGLQGALDAKADTSAIPTIPGNATASKAGLMSSEDKTKLDGLNNYVLPEATADVLGGVKVGAGLQIQDGKLTTSTESKTFANPEVIGASETLDLSTATNGVYSINGGSITGLTGSNDTAAALVINAGATHPSAIAFDGAFATDKVLPVCQDGTNWFKLTAMDRAEFVADPVGDTVTKEEFIALRDALVAAGIMKPKA